MEHSSEATVRWGKAPLHAAPFRLVRQSPKHQAKHHFCLNYQNHMENVSVICSVLWQVGLRRRLRREHLPHHAVLSIPELVRGLRKPHEFLQARGVASGMHAGERDDRDFSTLVHSRKRLVSMTNVHLSLSESASLASARRADLLFSPLHHEIRFRTSKRRQSISGEASASLLFRMSALCSLLPKSGTTMTATCSSPKRLGASTWTARTKRTSLWPRHKEGALDDTRYLVSTADYSYTCLDRCFR